MSEFYIKSDEIFTLNGVFSGYIKIKDGVIEEISKVADESIEIKDYTGKIVAPGYFDTHVHGYGGHDIMDATKEGLLEISKGIVQTGVTSFLATTLTDSTEKLDKACKNVGDNKDFCEGAKVQGIFLEGPFFTEEFKGAQNPDYMTNPDINKLSNWKKLSKGLVNKIAIAPERENSEEFIKDALKLGVKVALGHSNATYEQAKKAVDVGANIFVHIYNGMSPLHHRNPGMVGAALSTENTYGEVICDGHHVHPGAVKVVMRAKTYDNTLLITDCMMAGGMPEGDYKLGDFDVKVENGTARIQNGSLAGSILRLDNAVKNIVKWGLASPFDAVKMASLIPAKSVDLDDKIGSISIGRCADINILDKDMNVLEVYIDGKRKF
ncbi:N-acetylglucosamine-6-phosphate deacetylase [Peptoanaerobacter stomatis]|uniref:N-acetylglucosamine-6-phosphate deacetylase n=1 Tax=Peptoanaerobacter stomatis TaxID=796937 RepID=J5WQP9_9FIRM|nr:N-acetylglucosamine-6-phosphate deacetylase [Peptoanaerobacter stomatis]EJU23687.1 N-acetylglucosamine-6-phosphate deacetylase [Peptoanaerobacter stomatis]NWO24604.1 N-acetylglucosamine-6-phosphate deacetylase [Peptostreptococcaceae bacterium oral taxon 081]